MKVTQVSNLLSRERFLYWIRERHNIYLKRRAGKPPPWTDDEILQRYFFTNPYRENDKTTVWVRENIREPREDDSSVVFAVIAFRWFNYITTGEILLEHGKLDKWDPEWVCKILTHNWATGRQVFTGAYMINSPGGMRKVDAIVERITNVWKDRGKLAADLFADCSRSLEKSHKRLMAYPGMGGFMAYEVVCDLRYIYVLRKAKDVMTWCNPGPGCIRGLYRLAGEEIKNKSNVTSPPKPKDWQERMQKLLKVAQKKLKGMPLLEMREIEHSLCEWDKYERARVGDGKLKRRYPGVR